MLFERLAWLGVVGGGLAVPLKQQSSSEKNFRLFSGSFLIPNYHTWAKWLAGVDYGALFLSRRVRSREGLSTFRALIVGTGVEPAHDAAYETAELPLLYPTPRIVGNGTSPCQGFFLLFSISPLSCIIAAFAYSHKAIRLSPVAKKILGSCQIFSEAPGTYFVGHLTSDKKQSTKSRR